MVDAMSPPPAPPAGAPGFDAKEAVKIPAIMLMVLAGLGVAGSVISILLNVLGMGMSSTMEGDQKTMQMIQGSIGLVVAVLSLAIDAFVFYGALQMKNLKNRTMAMIASIIAIVPCYWSCCILGIPVGIWSLVVLSKPEVKAAFEKK